MIAPLSHPPSARRARPILVLMPGMDGTADLFASLRAVLEPDWRCQVIAYPTDAAVPQSALVEAARASLPSDPFVLVAESFSGPIAVALAAERPSGLRGVVLCASFLRSPVRGWRRLVIPLVRLAMRTLRPPRLGVRLGLLDRGAPRALVDAVMAAIRRVDRRVMVDRLDAVMRVDVTAQAARVEVPVLYIRATRDRLVGADALEVARGAFADLEAVHLDGPHLILQRRPEEAADAIRGFCGG